jgi:RNA polymerase primary sigma factor
MSSDSAAVLARRFFVVAQPEGTMRHVNHRTTPTSHDALTEYLNEIGRYAILDREQELALGVRIRAGDRDALNELVCGNLRFVVSIAKQYHSHGVGLLDLIAEGNVGLVRAARKFDHTRGIKFITYAVWWIRQAMMQALGEQSRIVRVPAHRAADVHRLGRHVNALFQKLGREPTQEEIAGEMEITKEEVAESVSIAQAHVSLDAPIAEAADSTLLDCLADDTNPSPDQESEEKSISTSISQALSQLRARDAMVLRLYFGFDGEEPKNLEQIGAMVGITRERVRQIRDRALRTLRQALPDLALAS